jgi:MOSC domain-containing protein YiiM
VPGRVVAVNVGRQVAVNWAGSQRATAIDKRPVDGSVPVGPLGVAGDEHGDSVNHGGIYQAVYAYAGEDADYWEAELGRALWRGAFGENLTTRGVDASSAVSGERWRVGAVELQVTVPRIPCRVFAGFWDMPDLINRFIAAGRPGAYLRVLVPGEIAAGDPIEVASRPAHGVTIAELLRARTGDRSLLPRVREVPGLPPKWQSWLDSVAAVKVPD